MNANAIKINTSYLILVLFIIGYFFHELMYALGYINRVPLGFVGSLSVLFFIFYFLFLLIDFKRTTIDNFYSFIVSLFFLFIFSWSTLNYLVVPNSYIVTSYIQVITTILIMFMLYTSALYNNFHRVKIYVYFFIFLFFYFLHYIYINNSFSFKLQNLSTFDQDDLATYQGLARSVALSGVFILPFIKNKWYFVILSYISVFSVFLLGARSELIFLIISIFILVLLNSVFNYKKVALINILCFLIAPLVFFFIFNEFFYNLDNRNLQLLNIENSSSFQGREYFKNLALHQVYNSPILGEFGGHVYATGSSGGYAHNFISAWVNFGIVGLLFYFYILIYPIFKALKSIFFDKIFNEYLALICALGIPTLVLIILSKPFFWPVPALLWGVYANYLNQQKRF